MNYVSSELSMQSYKQQLQYQTTVNAAENQPKLENIENDIENSVVSNDAINSPIVYNNENDLPMVDKAKKMLMQSLLDMFTKEGSSADLYPSSSMQMSKDNYTSTNPYEESLTQSPFGFVYESSQEYYEKTTIEFNAQATIKTPKGEYQIEINFSYTQEFYEKHETQIYYAQDNFDKPFEINLDEDDDSFKNLKRISLLFDILNEDNKEENNLLEEIKKIFNKRQHLMLKPLEVDENKIDNKFDNFRIFEKLENEEKSLLAIQKDGVGVFLSNSHTQSEYESASVGQNSISVQSAYYEQETKTMSIFTDLKA